MRKARSNAPNPWTAEQIERLKELLFARTPICEIARELGRTEGAVRTRAQQIGISLTALKRAWAEREGGPWSSEAKGEGEASSG